MKRTVKYMAVLLSALCILPLFGCSDPAAPTDDGLRVALTLYNLFPYVICLVVPALFPGHSHAPKSAGLPYGTSGE